MVSSPAFQRRPSDSCSSSRTLLPGFWLEPENLSISHQSSGPYTGFQLHLGLILKYFYSFISHSMVSDLNILQICSLNKPNRPLRSLGLSQLEIPRVHTKQGESAFSYYATRSWNQLPEEIRCAKTLATFKSSLKTHLFSCAFVEWALCYVWTDCIVFYV